MNKVKLLLAGHDWGGLNLLVPLLRGWLADSRFDVQFLSTPVIRRDVEHLVRGIGFAPGSRELTEWLHYRRTDLDAFLASLLKAGRYDLLLCGTSAHALLERRLFVAARNAGVPSIAFCDMWWAYAERFHDGEMWTLPDRLWVIDEPMREAAGAIEWPEPMIIEVIGSPLFGDLVRRRRTPGAQTGTAVRFVSEPVSIKYPAARIDEFEMAEMVLAALKRAGIDCPFIVRPHPADSQEAWRRWCFARGVDGVRLDTLPLEEAIADTRYAVGISSILLTEMRMCGVPAASVQPPGSDPSYYCLPFEDLGIARLADAEAVSRWLLEPGAIDAPASAMLHFAAHTKATGRVLEMVAPERRVAVR